MKNILSKTFWKVKTLLETEEKYRDNDERLVVKYWWEEMKRINIDGNSITAKDFFIMYRDGKFTTADCITRARRKCNEEFPNTKGLSYNHRKRKAEETKQEIRELAIRGMTP